MGRQDQEATKTTGELEQKKKKLRDHLFIFWLEKSARSHCGGDNDDEHLYWLNGVKAATQRRLREREEDNKSPDSPGSSFDSVSPKQKDWLAEIFDTFITNSFPAAAAGSIIYFHCVLSETLRA